MSSAINYFKARRSVVKDWFNSKGFSGTLHDAASAYFQDKSGLSTGTLYDHMDKVLTDAGYEGTFRDKLNKQFLGIKPSDSPSEAERSFFADQSTEFGFIPLLDEYSNSTAAYALRKMKKDATASIRVRRSSDDAEQDIGFAANNLDTTSLASFLGATDGFIVTWYDQSGNGKNATQSTKAYQAKVYDSSTGVLYYPGTNKVVAYKAADNGGYAISSAVSMKSIFWVNRVIALGGYGVFGGTSFSSVAGSYLNYLGSGGDFSMDGNAVSDVGVIQINEYNTTTGGDVTAGILVDDNMISSVIYNPGDPATTSVNLFSVAANSATAGLRGYYSELVVFSDDKTADRGGIRQSIDNYYGFFAKNFAFASGDNFTFASGQDFTFASQ